jgi:hypothetical protein
MNHDNYATMLYDGNALIDILQSVPESKRPLLTTMAEAFINGMLTQEQLMKRALEHPEPTPAQ